MPPPPKVLLFDLGGVIVKWTGIEALMRMKGLTRDEVVSRFENSSVFRAYETGHCSDDEFSQEMIAVFDLEMSVEDFKLLWQSWVGTTYPGTKSALAHLRDRYTVACLSNTNALHWACLRDHILTDVYFDHAYASHLIHQAKPDVDSYLIPARDIGVDPSDIWFFDDTDINIKAAREIGMSAFHVDRSVGVVPTLVELGLIAG